MIILIEGPDKTGKSTLCRELSQRLDIPIFQTPDTPLRGKPVSESQAEDEVLMSMLETTKPDVIMDRYFPSEYAYGIAYKRDFDVDRLLVLDERMSKLQHVCVNVSRKAPLLADNEVSESSWLAVRHAYRDYFDLRSDMDCIDGSWEFDQNLLIEAVMLKVAQQRPLQDEMYMQLAKDVAKRSTCLSRRNGTVLVSESGHLIATGYNGPPSGMEHPTTCQRLREGSASGSNLDACNDVHGEENAVAQAAMQGHAVRGGKIYTMMSPCHRCWRMLVASGISEIIYDRPYGDVHALSLPGVRIRRLGEQSS